MVDAPILFQVINVFNIDVSNVEIQGYLEETMVPKGDLAHQLVDSLEDNPVAAAIDMALSVLESTEVSDRLM